MWFFVGHTHLSVIFRVFYHIISITKYDLIQVWPESRLLLSLISGRVLPLAHSRMLRIRSSLVLV